MKTAVVLLLAAGLAAPQDPAKPKARTEFKLLIEGSGPAWTFTVEGTTTLPDGAVLKARLFAAEEVDDYKGGKRIDEETLIHEGRGFRLYTVKGGKFREKLLTVTRKPYTIWYRARLIYDPDVQDIPILDKAGETELDWTVDVKPAAPRELDREIAGTLKELTGEMEEVQSLFRDLKGKFQIWTRAPDAAAFGAWRKNLAAKTDAMRKKNEARYSLWVVWIERQAKFRFEQFCDRFDMLCSEFEELLPVKAKVAELSKDAARHAKELKETQDEEQDRQLRIMYGLAGFAGYFEEAREALGIDTPADPDAVGAILKDYEAAMTDLAALSGKGDAAWKAEAPAARAKSRRALLKLSAPGLLPRRAYDRVLELTESSGRLIALLGKVAAGEKADPAGVAAEHSTHLAEFRKYAGVP